MPRLSSRLLNCVVPALALLAAACDRQSSETAQPEALVAATASGAEALSGTIDRSHKGSLLPEFAFSDPAGRQLRLSSLKGKPLLVNLWATWCGPCVIEMPMLEKLAAAGDVKVLTVSQDMGDPQKVAAFFTDRHLTSLEPWLDPKGDLATHYAASTLPTTIYYDAQGREVWRFVGGHDWSSPDTARMLAETS